MKNMLKHAILAGLFVMGTASWTSFAQSTEETTPAPAPVESEPVEVVEDPVQFEPLQPLAEPVTPETQTTEETVENDTVPVTKTQGTAQTTAPAVTTDPTPARTTQAEPQAIAAKVIVVDRAANTLTIEANGKLQLVKITPQVRILKMGKLVPLTEITSGTSIVLLGRPLEDGTFEVVSVSVGAAKGQQAAGPGQGKALGVGFGQRVKDNPPFFNFPNPANQLGPQVTPSE